MKDWQSCISVFEAYLKISSNNWRNQPRRDNSIPCMGCGRFIKIKSKLRRKKLHRTNHGPNFLGGTFSNRDNVRALVQFRRETQPQHVKR